MRYGEYGGRYVPETLVPVLEKLKEEFESAKKDPEFMKRLCDLLGNYAGRPTPLYFAENMSNDLGMKIFLKREDLLHTGAHKINNTLGQGLLAKRMGKKRIIAETGAGQHGVASATACALLELECVVYMGKTDMERQKMNVERMKLLGAEVVEVDSGSRTLKDAINEAMRDYAGNFETTHYMIGSALGPAPYPEIVAYFQSYIGREAYHQIIQYSAFPDYVIACVGGGSNSIGIFSGFIDNRNVKLIGVEAGGLGIETKKHAARFSKDGKKGILHGSMSYVLQDEEGQIMETHSISAGLDYPAIGPEHAFLHDKKRAEYVSVTDEQALEAFKMLSRREGIIPALESAHAIAYAVELSKKEGSKGKVVLINLSGRGDKDLGIVLGNR